MTYSTGVFNFPTPRRYLHSLDRYVVRALRHNYRLRRVARDPPGEDLQPTPPSRLPDSQVAALAGTHAVVQWRYEGQEQRAPLDVGRYGTDRRLEVLRVLIVIARRWLHFVYLGVAALRETATALVVFAAHNLGHAAEVNPHVEAIRRHLLQHLARNPFARSAAECRDHRDTDVVLARHLWWRWW